MKRGKAHTSLQPGSSSNDVPYEEWINSYPIAAAWMSQYDVDKLVDDGGGLARISNFLPEHIAEGILATLERIPKKRWQDTSASEDYTHNNIAHSFVSTKQGVDAICRLFGLLRPGCLNAFSAACYQHKDHIAPHDDRAYTPVRLDSGRVITTSRDLAVIYYLTKDWHEGLGGVLVDLEDGAACRGGRRYVPQFNSAVAFRVPRYHEVTPMQTDKPRYSIFGWFLLPGKRYELYTGEEAAGQLRKLQQRQDQKQEQQQQQADAAAREAPPAKRRRCGDGDGSGGCGAQQQQQRRSRRQAGRQQDAPQGDAGSVRRQAAGSEAVAQQQQQGRHPRSSGQQQQQQQQAGPARDGARGPARAAAQAAAAPLTVHAGRRSGRPRQRGVRLGSFGLGLLGRRKHGLRALCMLAHHQHRASKRMSRG